MKKLFTILLSLLYLLPAMHGSKQDDNSWSQIFKKSKDCIAQIIVNRRSFNWFEPYRKGLASTVYGSGFFVSSDGEIYTNFHVIKGAEDIHIKLSSLGSEQFKVEFLGGSPDFDCARLKLLPSELARMKELLEITDIPFLNFESADSLTEGEEVMVAGYPLGQDNVKNATGIISGRKSQKCGEWITTTVPTNPGNSGGPYLNKNGKIVGIHVAHASNARGMAYLIPISNLDVILPELVNGNVVRAPFWGLEFSPITHETLQYLGVPRSGGALVSKVLEQSLGRSAGLLEGDIITHIDNCKIDRFCRVKVPWTECRVEISDVLMRYKRNESITFKIYRKGKEKKLATKVIFECPFLTKTHYLPFESKPDYEIIGGMVIMQLTMNHLHQLLPIVKKLIESGVLIHTGKYLEPEHQYKPHLCITHIMSGSQLDQSNLFSRSVHRFIKKVNGKPVSTLQELREAILDHSHESHFTIETEGGAKIALSIDTILEKEPGFGDKKGYQMSPLYHTLSKVRKNAL